MQRMSPKAREAFTQNLPALDREDVKSLFFLDYAETPVDVHTFINDDYFLGRTLRGEIFPVIEEDLTELFAGQCSEVVLKGGIGVGKTTCAYIGIGYDIYKVSCLKNPANAFGLIPGTSIAFLNFSARKIQAKKILFGGLLNLIHNSPYFNEKFPYDKKITSELRFPRGVSAYPVAANEQSMLGEGVFSAAMDEVNFYNVVEKSAQDPDGGTFDQAVVLYNKISTRIRSRMNQRGMLPGHLWIVSSSRYPTEFTEKKALEALTDPRIFVREHAVWEVKPRTFFMAQTFEVEVGDITRRSRVLLGHETDVNRERVITPPMDYYDDFIRDPEKCVRDLAGIATLSIRPFISQRELIGEMFKKGDVAGMKHPFSDFTVTLQNPSEHLIPENLHWIIESVNRQPVRRLYSGPYFFHIDLAVSGDAAGLCVCHIVGSKQVPRGYGRDRKMETKPIIRVDLLLQIQHPPHGEIQLSSARGVLYQLRELGMQFGKGSYDSWNSKESLQTLASEGFTVETYSVDKEPVAYEELRQAIYDQRIESYRHPVLEMELATLIMNPKKHKIDHPTPGSKDVADGLAGAVHHAEEAFTGGASSQWQNALSVNTAPLNEMSDDEELWDKINNGIPLTPEEIARLK